MFDFALKTLKIGFLALLPIFLISTTNVERRTNPPDDFEGSYNLDATGILEQELKGFIHYETVSQSIGKGTETSKLILKLVNDNLPYKHTMEFIISKQNQSHGISAGKYKVPENIEGFLNDFDGVFGFANMNMLGEEPLFASNGKIVITEISNGRVRGYLNMSLKNTVGKKMYIKGNFNAAKQHGKKP